MKRIVVAGLALAVTAAVPLPAHAAEPISARPAAAREVNSRPVVVPALQQWTGGTGRFRLSGHSRVVASPKLAGLGRSVADDIGTLTGHRIRATVGRAHHGDIALSIDTSLKGNARFAEEGYRLAATRDGVRISAPTKAGVLYGTKSLLQILLRDDTRDSVPAGTATDWPDYKVRGFLLDTGRRYFKPEFIRSYLRLMSWFKFNTMQIHLNDNEIKAPDGDWSKAYSAFRLKSTNPAFAGLAAKDGSYTRRDWNSFEDTAAANGVSIVPEFDAPAHARAFIAFKPSLGMNNGDSDHLDLSKPATTAFMKSVFAEFTPWFRGRTVHFGADEYNASGAQFRDYFNAMAPYLRSLGKHPAAWGGFTAMTGSAAGYDRDVTINTWYNGYYAPHDADKDGYPFINTSDSLLYIVPYADYYHGYGLDGRYLYDSWTPAVFPGDQSVDPADPLLRGGMFAVWNDLVHQKYTETDVHKMVEPTLGVLGQKMWSGSKAGLSYPDFMGVVRDLGTGPSGIASTIAAAQPDEVSFGRPATASASSLPAANATDGIRTTRWASSGRGPWLQVDLGRATTVTKLTADWAYGGRYDVRVSTDGAKWTKVAHRTARPGTDTVPLTPVQARYVRITGTHGAYSLWSLHLFGSPDIARGRPTTASSSEVPTLGPANATDGDPATRWASLYKDGEWIQVDLGSAQPVGRVLLDWESAYGKDYDIQVSTDGTTWKTVSERRARTGPGVDEVDFPSTQARYVRMQGVHRGTGYGYSLYRFEVRG